MNRRRRNAYVMLALMLGGILVPISQSSHLREILHVPTLGAPPETGETAIDEALAAAYEQAQAQIEDLDRRFFDALPGEPQVPATKFRDHVDAGSRIGGVGDWNTSGHVPDAWGTTAVSATDGTSKGYHFHDSGGTQYPKRSSEDVGAYLVSPRIHLSSLPATLEGTDRTPGVSLDAGSMAPEVTPDATSGASGRVVLQFDSRHNLVLTVDDDGEEVPQETDYAEIVVFTQDPAVHGAVGGQVVERFRGASPTAYDAKETVEDFVKTEVNDQVDAAEEESEQEIADDVNLDSGEAGPLQDGQARLTGTDANGTTVAYDLTPWVGRNIWLGWHVVSRASVSPGFDFQNKADPDAGFYGWMVDDIRIEGPAHVQDLQILDLTEPRFRDPDGGDAWLMSSDHPPGFGVRVKNHGQVTSGLQAVLNLTWGTGSVECPAEEETLLPGQVTEVRFDCPEGLSLSDGVTYNATFQVDGSDPETGLPRPDMHPADNGEAIVVRGLHDVGLFQDPLRLDPLVGTDTTPSRLVARLVNPGIVDKDAALLLNVTYLGDGTAEPLDVTLDGDYIAYSDADGPVKQVLVPADPEYVQNDAVAVWDFQLLESGQYRLTTRAVFGGEERSGGAVLAGVDVAANRLYKASFDGGAQADDPSLVARDDPVYGNWTVQRWSDTKPPCHDDGTCIDRLWVLPQDHAATGIFDERRLLVLGAEADPQGVQDTDLFTSFDVRIVHQLQDLNCQMTNFDDACRGQVDSGEAGPLTVRLALADDRDRRALGEALAVGAGTAPDALDQAVTLQRVEWGDRPLTRFGYHEGQWLEDTYSLSAQDLLDLLPGDLTDGVGQAVVPAEVARQIAIQFLFESHQRSICPTKAGFERHFCPLWRVASVEVEGHTLDGTERTIFRDRGNATEPAVGTWDTYGYFRIGTDGAANAALREQERTSDGTCTVQESDPETGAPSPESRAFICPGWTQAGTSDLIPAEGGSPQWRLFRDVAGYDGQEYWLSGDASSNPPLYEDDRVDALVSPALRIPEDAGEPTLTIDHAHRFLEGRGGTDPKGHSSRDKGFLMIRFLEEGTLDPASPFLPIAVHADAETGALPSGVEPHAFSRCLLRQSGGGELSGGCASMDQSLLDTGLLSEPVSLRNLTILDYTVLGFGGSTAWSDPDDAAKRVVDLRNDCDGECIFQVAFVTKTQPVEMATGPLPSLSALGPTTCSQAYCAQVNIKGADRFKSNQPLPGETTKKPGEGWRIGGFEITRDDTSPNNVRLNATGLDAAYDLQSLGLGPGTEAQVSLDVHNDGLLPVREIDWSVEVRHEGNDTLAASIQETASVAIDPGNGTVLSGALTLPEIPGGGGEGAFRVVARVSIDRVTDKGILVEDGRPKDNCMALEQIGDGLAFLPRDCSNLDAAPSVLLRRVPDLRIDLEVSPLEAYTGFDRERRFLIENRGNVEVAKAFLTVTLVGPPASPGGEGTVVEEREACLESQAGGDPSSILPGPGTSKRLGEITGAVCGGGERDDWDSFFNFVTSGSGTHQAVARLEPVLAQDEAWRGDVDVVTLRSFTPFFVDQFDDGGTTVKAQEMLSGTLHAEPPQGPDGAQLWNRIEGDGVGYKGTNGAWHFGSYEDGEYGDGLDASLVFPEADLTSARAAYINFAHRYDLEDFYDGGRMEVSLDGGETWTGLDPHDLDQQRLIHNTNPLQDTPGDDGPVRAFTGDSRSPLQDDGWIISTFNLGSVPGLVTDVDLARFPDEGLAPYEPPAQGSPAVRFRTGEDGWNVVPDASCTVDRPDGCWNGQNQWHVLRPQPDPEDALQERLPPSLVSFGEENAGPGDLADGEFWWSGSLKDQTSGDPWTRVDATLDVSSLGVQDGDSVTAHFWAWKDHGGEFTCTAGRVGGGQASCPSLTREFVDEETGWSRYRFALDTILDGTDPVRTTFRYQEEGALSARNQGLVVDDLWLELTRPGQGTVGVAAVPNDGVGWEPLSSDSSLFNFTRTDEVSLVPDQWDPLHLGDSLGGEVTNRKGEVDATVWWHGSCPGGSGSCNYSSNAADRLVTPLIDLRQEGGDEATLHFWERFDLPEGDVRNIWVQSMEFTPVGTEVFGDWVHVATEQQKDLAWKDVQWTAPDGAEAGWSMPPGTGRDSDKVEGCNQNDWCKVSIDLSDFVGQRIRIGFELAADRLNPVYPDDSPANKRYGFTESGFHWAVDEVRIESESLVGRPVQLRLRAGTDHSLSGAGWTVDNFQFLGYTYTDNVALLTDRPVVDTEAGNGTTVTLDGTVRNLGKGTKGVAVVLDVIGLPDGSGQTPDDSLQIRVESPGDSGKAAEDHAVHLFPLGPAGSTGAVPDRYRFNASFALPDGVAEGSAYDVNLRLMRTEPTADGGQERVPLQDENLPDHDRRFTVTVKNTRDVAVDDVVVGMPTVTNGTGVPLQATFHNAGTFPAVVTPSFQVIDPGVQNPENPAFKIAELDVDPLVIPAGENATVGTTWTAETHDGTGAGFYRVQVAGSYAAGGEEGLGFSGAPDAHVLVDDLPIYYEEGFEQDDWGTGWASAQVGSQDPCPPSGSPAQGEQWHRSGVDPLSGDHAYRFGQDDSNTPVTPGVDAYAESPGVDLSGRGRGLFFGDAAGQETPFAPVVSFAHKARLGINDGLVVQAVLGDGPEDLLDPGATAYDGIIRCTSAFSSSLKNPLADGIEDRGIPGESSAVTGGSVARWRSAVFRLDDTVPGALGEDDLGLRFRLGSDAASTGRYLQIDDVAVSAYDSKVEPAQAHAFMQTHADKRFAFVVTNTGAATDTYDISLDPAWRTVSGLPGFLNADVVDGGVLELDPGESGEFIVRFWVDPDFDPHQLEDIHAAKTVPIEIRSQTLASRVTHAELVMDRFLRTDLPDPSVRLSRPSGSEGPFAEEVEDSVLVTVKNLGVSPSRVSELFAFACPTDGQAPVTSVIKDCRDAYRAGHSPSQGGPHVLLPKAGGQGVTVPTLAQQNSDGDTASFVASWTPPQGSAGDYVLLAVLRSPGEQAVLTNDLAWMQVEVEPLQRPDVAVVDLRVTDADGEPVRQALEGDALTVQATVANLGVVPAQDVIVKIQNRLPLKRVILPELDVGEEVGISASWIAQQGNWLVEVEGLAPTQIESRNDNNARAWSLVVGSDALTLDVDPAEVALSPGQITELTATVENRRDAAIEGVLVIDAPPDVTVLDAPDEVRVGRGQTLEIPVTLEASVFLEPGETDMVLSIARSPTAPPLAKIHVPIVVAGASDVQVSAEVLVGPPGPIEGDLVLSNQGNEDEDLGVLVRPPANWGAQVRPEDVSLAPGAESRTLLSLHAPAGTPPGSYVVHVLDATGRGLGAVNVTVTEAVRWSSLVDRVEVEGDSLRAWVRVTNTGNTAGVPWIGSAEGAGRLVIDPLPSVVAAGETQTFQVLAAADNETRLDLPGGSESVPLAAAEAPGFHILEVNAEPPLGGSDSTKVTARFDRQDPLPLGGVPVRLYVDGVLVRETTMDLPDQGPSSVTMEWPVQEGSHVLTVSVGSGEDAVARSSVVEVPPSAARDLPAPGIAWTVALMAAALLIRRRWIR